MNNWPSTGSLLFVATEEYQSIPYTFAKKIICNTEQDIALWEAKSHPDFRVIQPEDSRHIRIDQIRLLKEWANERPSIATSKVAIFHPADALNIQAANALLKTLEEPSLSTLMILITAYPDRLLSTIRSRCHIIRYRTNDRISSNSENSINQLSQEVMRDLATLERGEIDPIKLAEVWCKKDVGQMLYWIIIYLNETIKKSVEENQMIRCKSWWALFEHAMQAKQVFDDKTPVNLQLLIETLFIHYSRVLKGQTYG